MEAKYMKRASLPQVLMYVILCFTLIFALGLMAGCKGDTGDAGAAGAPGATGPTGPTGPVGVAAANEQCLVCHGPGTIEPISAVHTLSPLSATTEPLTVDGNNVDINEQSAAQLAGLTMTGSAVVTIPTVTPVVNFSVTTGGHGVIGLTTTNIRFALAKLVSAATGTYWQSYMVTSATSRPGNDSGGTLVDNGDGTYVYTFGKNITTVPGVTFDANATHRMAIQISGNVAGGSLNDRALDIITDFVPAGGTAISHDIVTAAACNACHYKLGTTTPHGGRVDTKYCAVCHTYQRANGRSASSPDATGTFTGSTYLVSGQVDNPASDPTSTAGGFAVGELVTMVHKIHKSEELSLKGYNYGGVLFNEVTYPQDIRNCTTCHNGPQADNWKNKPSRKACGSCHDNVSWATTVPTGFVAHSAGANDDDTSCAGCHPATGGLAGITDHHIPIVPPDPTDPRLGGTNTHTNAEYIAAAGVVPPGAHRITHVISSVTVTNNHPSITFKLQSDGADIVFTAPTSTTSELAAGFAGSPSAYFAWAEPQDGITAPADFNKTASVYIKSVWNGSIAGSTATITGPDGSGFYTITRTGTTLPATAVMLTGGIGYTYGSGSPPLVQTGLTAYPYNAATGVGGLSVPAPNVWKVATGFTGRRAAVDTAKCNACHAALGAAPTFHVGQRNDAPTCSFCHNPNRTSQGWAVNASTFVHAIHGASKRTAWFTWDAVSVAGDEADEGFFQITYPNLLNNCQACHVAGFYDFSNSAYTANNGALMKNLLFSTAATGTFSSTDPAKFAFSPYVALDTNYGSSGAAANLVTSPIAAACFSCHDAPAAMSHMKAMGAAIYQSRGTAIQP
jgi:OmcA/MtrC family decaheme c-type cytochrome